MDKDSLMLALMICLTYDPETGNACDGCPLKGDDLCRQKLFIELSKIVYSTRDIRFLIPEKE